ncbi:hypothetical protein JCM14469_23910 [Desulfatiferula olefinivorans]
MTTKKCPCGKGEMHLCTREKKARFNGEDVNVASEAYVCAHCGIEAGTAVQASVCQRAVSEAYRRKVGLLTGDEIRRLRLEKRLSPKQLADLLNVAEDSVRKWEEGLVQDHVTDRALRTILA